VTDAEDLTVFVVSTGEETADECMAALEAQTRKARVELIAGVYPMSAAFQAMPDRCETRYFLQVDADMILNEDAVERLHRAIRRSGPWTFQVSAQLYEEGFGVGGAVKCWKRSLFRHFSFRDVRTVDRDLYRRTRRFGLRPRRLKSVVGIHRPRHSPVSELLKTKGDVEKWRYLGRPAEQYARPLVRALAEEAGGRDRLLGAALGALTIEPRLSRSKDVSYERALREQVLSVLGEAGDESVDLEPAFAAAYASRPEPAQWERAQLAEAIVRRFGSHESDPTRLLALFEGK
jgi:hypothetical protein